ncbi:uncharacterized protein SCHCODRAFT_02493924, partial [Schizophyllum commune H4-8]|uniref:uncharacterized protein n=1 Tax=Schizophyllum commune (strain H4-8 / FGSC 9210) TaxID=578458 RepID=UPI00215FF1D8
MDSLRTLTSADASDAARHRDATMRAAQSIPDRTTDTTEFGTFSRPFDEGEIKHLKKQLRARQDSATGIDAVAYKAILDIDNDLLATFFTRCISLLDNYRIIGLESCLLAALTLLVDHRFREWAEDGGLIPPSQNGFHEGYRTNNNIFILRCAIERARASGRPLYVVFVDLKNAFPSTDQAMLWSKLWNKGASGPIFD